MRATQKLTDIAVVLPFRWCRRRCVIFSAGPPESGKLLPFSSTRRLKIPSVSEAGCTAEPEVRAQAEQSCRQDAGFTTITLIRVLSSPTTAGVKRLQLAVSAPVDGNVQYEHPYLHLLNAERQSFRTPFTDLRELVILGFNRMSNCEKAGKGFPTALTTPAWIINAFLEAR